MIYITEFLFWIFPPCVASKKKIPEISYSTFVLTLTNYKEMARKEISFYLIQIYG